MKLRFDESYKAIERSAREADRRKCDMLNTVLWWSINKDDTGFYLEIPEEDTKMKLILAELRTQVRGGSA